MQKLNAMYLKTNDVILFQIKGFFSFYKYKGMFWFRFFGYGLHGKNYIKHHLLFSERTGYKKFVKIGKWVFKILKTNDA